MIFFTNIAPYANKIVNRMVNFWNDDFTAQIVEKSYSGIQTSTGPANLPTLQVLFVEACVLI